MEVVMDRFLEELRTAWFDVEWELHDSHAGVAVASLAHHEAFVKLEDLKIIVRRYDSPWTFPCNVETGATIAEAVEKMQTYLKREAENDAW
jgi:hypothetical protein